MLWPRLKRYRRKDKHFFEVAFAKLATHGSEYRGVTGISPLSQILNPAEVNVFDPMHLVYRGNAALIFSRFFESTFSFL